MSNLPFKLLFNFILLLVVSSASAQVSTAENIKYIRNVFTQINSQKNLDQLKLENEELTEEATDGGVSMIGFFKEKTLLKVEQWAWLSYGTIQIEYYFDKDSLIFVYVTENHFRQSGDSLDHSKIEVKFEGRYYLKNDKLIHKTTKGSGFWSDSTDGVQSLLEDSKTYLKFLYSKKNNDG
jgi:hypothetical protein